MGLGDAIAKISQPIASGIDHIAGTDLKNCSGCKSRQARLNRFSDNIYDRFFGLTHSIAQMDFIVTKTSTISQQIAITANTPEEAETKVKAGEGTSIGRNSSEQYNAQARPAAMSGPARPIRQSAS